MALPINLTTQTVTIANGTSLSGSVGLGANTLVGIFMPAAWAAAGLSFQMSLDGSTFGDVHSSSAELTYTAAAGQYIAIDPALWRGINLVKVRSGISGTPVNQTADSVITLVTRPVA